MSEKETKKPTTTEELLEQIKKSSDIGETIKENDGKFIKDGIHIYLEKLIKKKGIKKAELIKTLNFDKTYLHQIFNGTKKPSRTKLLQLCLGMNLTLDEVQTLLKYGGYAQLYTRVKFDSVIIYALEHNVEFEKVYDMLEELGLEMFNNSLK